jgi:glucose-6-phosphate 1-dehydrogenase
VTLGNVSMDFAYKAYFDMAPSTGYETLIYDCMIGDATLFQRADNIEAGWQAVQPILDAWASNPVKDIPTYVPPTSRAATAPTRRTNCWRATGAPGGRSNETTALRSRWQRSAKYPWCWPTSMARS